MGSYIIRPLDNEEIKKNWFSKNHWRKNSCMTKVESLSPEYGIFITVDGIDIPKRIFEEEYNQIRKALNSINDKLSNWQTTHNKDCAVTQSEIATPKPSNDGFAQS